MALEKRVIAKHAQCKGYRIISKELHVTTVANIIKKFGAHETGCGHKIIARMVSSHTTCCCLNGSALHDRKPLKTPFLREGHKKPDWTLSECLLMSCSTSGRMCLELFGKSYQPYLEKMKQTLQRKWTLYLSWNMKEVQWCFRVPLLPQAPGALNLFRVQWSQKTVKTFWSQTYNPVSENCVLVCGHDSSNRTNLHEKALNA